MSFDFSTRFTAKKRKEFVDYLLDLSDQIGFKVSARGWCYLMEQNGFIGKSEFSKVENAINKCRKEGMLPVDFVAVQKERSFGGVIQKRRDGVEGVLAWMLDDFLDGGKYFTPDYWEDENYYIQVLVEKVDLVTLFEGVCSRYKIPIGNAKGWQSILQRADYLRRFKEAKKMGLKCVLLYCGDFDPDGRLISDIMKKNLRDVEDVYFEGEEDEYERFDVDSDLTIDRFGLNLDFIEEKGLSWIDNLETGSEGYLAEVVGGQIVQGRTKNGRLHPNFDRPYVQEYLEEVGVRKCEANALVVDPSGARELMTEAIEKYLGEGAHMRFKAKRAKAVKKYDEALEGLGLDLDELREKLEELEEKAEENREEDDGLGNFRS